MKHLNFLLKSGSQSRSHNIVTLASTVSSPSAHRRGIMLKLISVLVLILTFGVGQMWGKHTITDQVYTFGSSSTPTGWTVSRTSGHASGYLKLQANDYLQMTTATIFASNEVLSSTNMKVEVSCGTFGTWNGTKSVKCTAELRKSDGTVLSTANATFSSLNSSEGTYRTAINVSKPSDPSQIAYLRITLSNFGTNNAVLRVKNVRLSYETDVTVSSFTVTYDGNGNTGGSVPTDNTAYNNGATVTVKENTGSLVKTNHAFGGWNTNAEGTGTDRAVGSTFSISANTTLYAKWIPTYTVTYNGNGNTSGSVPTDATKYQTGTTVTVKDNTGSLAKSGWTFSGWNKNNTGTSTNYDAGSGTFNISANTTLYAKWTRTVTWSVNGATNVYPASTVTYNATASKVASLPTAPNPASYCGDKFVGWTTDENYVHGESTLFTTVAGSPNLNSITTDVIFYAVFADYDE